MATLSSVTATPERPRTNRVRGICRYFSQPKGCFAGDQCKFLHVASDANVESTLSPYDANKVCRYFARGYCRRGTACWFKHELATKAAPVVPDRDDDDLVCTICFERPEEYGLLDKCNHVFCKTCIRGWRDPHGKSVDVLISQMNKTCPSCRTRSRFIIPSSRFPENAQRKEEIVNDYKASMARVECKYFVLSRDKPFCPYGRDCFYKHERADGTPYVFDEGVDALMERFKRRQQARRRSGFTQHDFMSAIRSIADSLFDVAAGVMGGAPQMPVPSMPAQNEEDDGPPPLERVAGESDDEEFTEDEEGEDESDDEHDYELALALQHSILAFHDTFRQTAGALGIRTPSRPLPAPAQQEPQDPNISRQYDVFDLD